MKHTLLILAFILPLIISAQSVWVMGGKRPVELQYNGSGITIIQAGDTTHARNMRAAMQSLWIETIDLHRGFWVTYQKKVILKCSMSKECYVISRWQGKPEVGLMSQFGVAILVEMHMQELFDTGRIFTR